MKKIFQKLLGAVAAAALALPVAAVQHPNLERGFDPNKAFELGQIDQVNLFNGNLSVTIPLGQAIQGDGKLSYGFNLVYNSKAWDWEVAGMASGDDPINSARADRRSNAGFGWRLTLGELYQPNAAPLNDSLTWVYVGPDGAEHEFFTGLYGGQPCTSNSPAVCYSLDGSYLRLQPAGSGLMKVENPNGTKNTFKSYSEGGRTVWRLDSIADVNGNRLAVNSTGNPWLLTEINADGVTVRTSKIHYKAAEIYDGRLVKMVDKVEVPAFGNTFATYQLQYTRTAVTRPILHELTELPNPVLLPLLTGVVLPDGSQFSMPATTSYQLTMVAGNGDIPGVLIRLGLPTGGRFEWGFRRWTFPTGESYNPGQPPRFQPDFITRSSGVFERRVYDIGGGLVGTTTYTSILDDPPGIEQMPVQKRTEVVDAVGNKTVNYFSVYQDNSLIPPQFASFNQYSLPFTALQNDQSTRRRFLSKEVYTAGQTTPVRRIWVAYDFEPGNQAEPSGIPTRRLASERIDYLDDVVNGVTSYKTIDREGFDGLGNFRWYKVNGNFMGTSSYENARDEFTNYNPTVGTWPSTLLPPGNSDPWVLGTFTEMTQTERGETARQEFCFDTKGLLKRQRTLAGANRAASDLLAIRDFDTLGNLKSEKNYGGDNQAIPTTALCSLTAPALAVSDKQFVYRWGALESVKYAAASHYEQRRDIDPSTGLPSKIYDVADVGTSLTYDGMDRVTWLKPDVGHDSWQQYVYQKASGTTPPRVFSYQYNNNSTTSPLVEERFYYDGIGRLLQEHRKMAGATSFSIRESKYNGVGWLTERTTWTTNPATAGKTIYSNFDAFGRPKYVDPPEGSHHRVEYFYSGDRRVARQYWVGYARAAAGNVAERKAGVSEEFDLYGRLRRVEEGSITNNPKDLIGTYTYTVEGKLKQVTLRPRDNSSTQNRYFTWDRRGFLLSEEHPETGKWVFSQYDANGNFNRKHHNTDPTRVLTYQYDAFERLIKVHDAYNNRPLKEWTYATANAAPNLRRGKVEVAKRFNYPRVPWNPGVTATIEVKETYNYSGRAGRPSSRTTELPAFSRSFSQSWTYDALGNLLNATYPRCTFAICTATAAPARTVRNQYDQGRLVGVENWATLSYHDNGMLNEVRHSNGMIDTYDRDPKGLPRVYNVKVKHPGRTPSQLGVHHYDGMGNLVRRQIDSAFEAVEGLNPDVVAPEGSPETIPEEEPVSAATPVAANYYLYDNFGRLTHFNDGSSKYQAYGYDPYSNITSITSYNGSGLPQTRTYAVAAATNRLTTGYGFDAAGNMTSRSLGTSSEIFEYDVLGELVSRNFPAETYAYTADGERLYSFFYGASFGGANREEYTLRGYTNQVYTVYEKTDVAGGGELWTWKKDYIYRGGQILGVATTDANVNRQEQHFSLDHLGTPRVTTDKLGSFPAIAIHHYWGYGEELSASTDPDRMRFTGHERAQNGPGVADDLDYMHARYYPSFLGRFQSPDPIQSAKAGSPMTFNKYAYASSNPLKSVDPDGRETYLVIVGPSAITSPGGLAGHAALWITSESGSRGISYLTKTKFDAGGLRGFVDRYRAQGGLTGGQREVRVYLIPTTPEQDRKGVEYLSKHPDAGMGGSIFVNKNNCTGAVIRTLKEGGVIGEGDNFIQDGVINKPSELEDDAKEKWSLVPLTEDQIDEAQKKQEEEEKKKEEEKKDEQNQSRAEEAFSSIESFGRAFVY